MFAYSLFLDLKAFVRCAATFQTNFDSINKITDDNLKSHSRPFYENSFTEYNSSVETSIKGTGNINSADTPFIANRINSLNNKDRLLDANNNHKNNIQQNPIKIKLHKGSKTFSSDIRNINKAQIVIHSIIKDKSHVLARSEKTKIGLLSSEQVKENDIKMDKTLSVTTKLPEKLIIDDKGLLDHIKIKKDENITHEVVSKTKEQKDDIRTSIIIILLESIERDYITNHTVRSWMLFYDECLILFINHLLYFFKNLQNYYMHKECDIEKSTYLLVKNLHIAGITYRDCNQPKFLADMLIVTIKAVDDLYSLMKNDKIIDLSARQVALDTFCVSILDALIKLKQEAVNTGAYENLLERNTIISKVATHNLYSKNETLTSNDHFVNMLKTNIPLDMKKTDIKPIKTTKTTLNTKNYLKTDSEKDNSQPNLDFQIIKEQYDIESYLDSLNTNAIIDFRKYLLREIDISILNLKKIRKNAMENSMNICNFKIANSNQISFVALFEFIEETHKTLNLVNENIKKRNIQI